MGRILRKGWQAKRLTGLVLAALFAVLTIQAQTIKSVSKVPTIRDLSQGIASEQFYAVSFYDSALYKFDSANGALLQTLVAPYSSSLLSGPQGLTDASDGNLYISSQSNNSILKYDLATNTLSTFIPSAVLQPIAATIGLSSFAPAGLRFGVDGRLYVSLNGGASSPSGAIVRFNITRTGGTLSYAGTYAIIATGLVQPLGITFGPRTTDPTSLYVSNAGAGNVLKITNATTNIPSVSLFIAANSGGLNYPSGLTWGPGGLYVTDLGATSNLGQVLKFNADGTFDSVFSQTNSLLFQFPSDTLFLLNGNAMTANLGPAFPPNLQGSIFLFNSSGAFVQTLVSSAQFPNTGPGTSGISPAWFTRPFLPTAANVAISGHVLTTSGAGLQNTIVSLTKADGETVSTRTNTFGYYHFDNIAAGQPVIVAISSKRYQFTPQVVNVQENLTDLNFIALE